MKTIGIILFVISTFILMDCEPTIDQPFEKYTIPAGKHYSTYKVELLQNDILSFQTKFDETAEYTSKIPVNQWDTNKLFGFADCNSFHHVHSARFGWRWLDGKIDIIAYCYVSGERIIEVIGSTQPGIVNNYEIQLLDSLYRFKFDDTVLDIQRHKPCDLGEYYLLFPYFGGDETAPHDVNIYIRRMY